MWKIMWIDWSYFIIYLFILLLIASEEDEDENEENEEENSEEEEDIKEDYNAKNTMINLDKLKEDIIEVERIRNEENKPTVNEEEEVKEEEIKNNNGILEEENRAPDGSINSFNKVYEDTYLLPQNITREMIIRSSSNSTGNNKNTEKMNDEKNINVSEAGKEDDEEEDVEKIKFYEYLKKIEYIKSLYNFK